MADAKAGAAPGPGPGRGPAPAGGLQLPINQTYDAEEALALFITATSGSTALQGRSLGTGRDGGSGEGVHGMSDVGTGVQGDSGSGVGVFGTSDSQSGVLGTSKHWDGVHGESQSAQHAGVSGINNSGGIGVYGASSGRAGYFAGNVHADGDLSAGGSLTANKGFFAADVSVLGTLTAKTDVVLGSDCAEDFDVAPYAEVEPGTVMVLTDKGALEPSHDAYDRKVAGVISGAGEYKPGLILGRRNSSAGRWPLALVGKVYCKVDAGYGPVEIGDLLTTSPTPGHAMRADDPQKAFGAVIGKSLGGLEAGCDLVPILVALQ